MKRSMIYVSLENRCRVKHNTSRKLASLRINVHSVKKINWINTINSPQRCRISLVFSPRHLKSYSLCFQKINICLCTVLRESRGFEMGGCFFFLCVKYLQSWWFAVLLRWSTKVIQMIRHKRFDLDSNNMVLWRWNGNHMQSEWGVCFSQNQVQ